MAYEGQHSPSSNTTSEYYESLKLTKGDLNKSSKSQKFPPKNNEKYSSITKSNIDSLTLHQQTSLKEGGTYELLKEAKDAIKYQQSKKLEELHNNISQKRENVKAKAISQNTSALEIPPKSYKKCCTTCKDIGDSRPETTNNSYLLIQNQELISDKSRKNSDFSKTSKCKCSEELTKLKTDLLSEQKLREFYQRQLQDLQQDLSSSQKDIHQDYMGQFKQMQDLIKDKNGQIQDLMLQIKVYENIYSNFKFLRSLSNEYMHLELPNGKNRFSEREKVSIEQSYIEFVKKVQNRVDQEVQVNLKQDNDQLIQNLKETLNLEKEVKALQDENQLLKSKLYSAALNTKGLDFKIENLKEQIDGSEDEQGRLKSDFVEKFSDFIFKLHNIGVQDMKGQIGGFIKVLYDQIKVFDLMPQTEMTDWVQKLYNNKVQITGIKRQKSTVNNNKQISFEESVITGNSACDSGNMYLTPNNILHNLTNSTTIKDAKTPPKQDRKLKQVKEEKEDLLQMLCNQAHYLEEQFFLDQSFI